MWFSRTCLWILNNFLFHQLSAWVSWKAQKIDLTWTSFMWCMKACSIQACTTNKYSLQAITTWLTAGRTDTRTDGRTIWINAYDNSLVDDNDGTAAVMRKTSWFYNLHLSLQLWTTDIQMWHTNMRNGGDWDSLSHRRSTVCGKL